MIAAPKYRILWKSISIFILTGICFFGKPIGVQSQSLNLSGLIALDYHSTVTLNETAGKETKSKTSDLLQSYMISSSGVIVDPRLASYSANIGISDSSYNNIPSSGESTKVSRDTITYGLQMNLLPTRIPINVFFQRNVRAPDLFFYLDTIDCAVYLFIPSGCTAEEKDTMISDTFSIGWAATLRTKTALRATLLNIGTEDNFSEYRKTRVRIANFGLSQSFRTGFLAINLQYTDYLVETEDEKTQSKVGSFSIRGEHRLSPFLFLNENVTYFPSGSFFTPGITTTAETTGDIGLLNQVERFTQSGNYSFRKTEGGELERDAIAYSVSYRPLGKTDYRGDAVYTSTGGKQIDSKEYRLAGGVSHRPSYGLSITDNIILHHFDVAGINDSNINRIGNIIGINYFKLLNIINLNSNYSADYSTVFSNDENADGNILTQTASVGVQSRTLQAAQIMASYTILLRNNTIVPTDDRQEQSVRIEAQSNYFNRFHLRAASSLSDVLDYGVTFTFDTRAEYYYGIGTRLAGEYKLTDYPAPADTQDSQLYIIEANHSRNITWRLGMNLNLRGERQEFKSTDRDRLIMTAMLNYQLGRVTLNLEFREDYTKYPESVYNIQTYFVRASRPF